MWTYRLNFITKWEYRWVWTLLCFVLKDSSGSLFSLVFISLTSAKSCKIVSIFQFYQQFKQQLIVQKTLTIKIKMEKKTTLTLTLKNTICPMCKAVQSPLAHDLSVKGQLVSLQTLWPREHASSSLFIALYFISEEAHAQHTHQNNIKYQKSRDIDFILW